MILYDAEFWNAYYRWCIRTPTDRIMARMSGTLLEVQLTISDRLTPVVVRAKWTIEDFLFAYRLTDEPRWKRPWLRLLHSISKVRRLVAA